jgi:antitoxin component YwqK of YwqJK toxin-antitoxin module
MNIIEDIEFYMGHSSGDTRNGLKVGPWVTKYPTDEIWATHMYDYTGRKHGLCQIWHKNGNLKARGFYRDDMREGIWEFWSEEGKKIIWGRFENDMMEGFWVFRTKRGSYKEGKMHGKWVKLYGNGIKAIEGTYNMGVKDGYFIFRYYSGMVSKEGAYENGIENGLWFEYSPCGVITQTINYN